MVDRFSEYVSLGINCEVAFQFRRVLGRDESSFFSWNVTPLEALCSLLASRFKGILEKTNMTPHHDGVLMNDISHNFKFHSPFEPGDFEDAVKFDAKLVEYRQKVGYLVSKFLKPRRNSEKVAYFYRADKLDEKLKVREYALKINDLLSGIHEGSDFLLIVLQDQSHFEDDWKYGGIRNRYLKRIAPWDDATDGHVRSWDQVFKEFPHVSEMRLAGF